MSVTMYCETCHKNVQYDLGDVQANMFCEAIKHRVEGHIVVSGESHPNENDIRN